MRFDITKYGSPRLAALIAALLTAAVFLPSLFNGFVDWDDHLYVFENDYIKSLSPANIKALFTREFAATYCPLPMITYALEHALFELDPFVYHLTNYLLHIAVTASVFFFIYLISRSAGAAFLTALVFGIHPLHVESVAWVSERKDLLAALFYMLTLIAYKRYLDDKKATAAYLALLFMALSLLSKAMAVTIPLMLFLMDYLQSRRMDARAFLEKTPFMALSVTFGIVTFYFQSSMGATALKADTAFRVYFISKSVLFYLAKIFFPINLSAIYPYHDINLRHLAMIKFNIAAIAGLGVFIIIAALRSKRAAFACLFSVITILPVLKIIPIGDVFAADRYMYLPSIGIFYLMAITAVKILPGKKDRLWMVKAAAIAALSMWMIWLSALSWQRCRVWKDTESLFSDVLKKISACAAGQQ